MAKNSRSFMVKYLISARHVASSMAFLFVEISVLIEAE